MLRLFSRKQHIALTAIYCVLIPINALLFASPIAGAILLVLFLFSTGFLLGPAVLPSRERAAQTAIGAGVMIAALSIVGSLIYYVGPAFQFSYIILIVVAEISATLFGAHGETEIEDSTEAHLPAHAGVLLTIHVLALAAWWSAVLSTHITEAVRTPWAVIPPTALLALVVAFFTSASLLFSPRTRRAGAFALGTAFFSAIALAAAAYPLGFGFDPFIHRTTVAHIIEHGTITPKPLYYIGQYALELISVDVFSLSLNLVDRLLVPLLATGFILASAGVSFPQFLKKKWPAALLALLLLPLGAFIATTPQSLAYVFIITLLFLSLPVLARSENAPPVATLGIFAIAAAFTHPLAGIPALIYFAMLAVLSCKKLPKWAAWLITVLAALLGSVALPVVFALQAQHSGLDVQLSLGSLFDWQKLALTGFFGNHYSSIFDGLYLVIDNLFYILVALALVGVAYMKKHHAPAAFYLPLIAAVMWFVNYWLLSTTLEFDFLIEYERQDYAVRLLTLASIFLIPYVAVAIAGIRHSLREKSPSLAIALAVFLALFGVANVYGAYPRDDNYARSAGFNVATTDFDAVYAINRDAGNGDYIVLANQAVSAAALEAFGFKKYYHDDIFYYPIPTGGELYNYYLEMADVDPTRERAVAAMDLAGVDTAYFVVNDYWWQSNVIIEHAKQESDGWFSVGSGAVTVFVYRR